jgi:hypothetical protein
MTEPIPAMAPGVRPWRPGFFVLLAISVPASSFLGLLIVSVRFADLGTAVEMSWGASLWASLVFTIGTLAATVVIYLGVRRYCLDRTRSRIERWRITCAIVLSMTAHLLVYAFAWALVWMKGDSLVLPNALWVVFLWGWLGWGVIGTIVVLYAMSTLYTDLESAKQRSWAEHMERSRAQ